MATTAVKVSHDLEYKHWLNEIEFYNLELFNMQHQLADFTPTFYKKYFAENVSHIQNRSIYLLEVIEILRHDIKQQKSDIKKLQAYPTPKLRDQVSRIHLRLKNDVAIFFDLYLEVKIDFSDFLA
jgi:hypothetical protein